MQGCLGRACEGFEAGQTAALQDVLHSSLGHAAARVALEKPARGLKGGFEACAAAPSIAHLLPLKRL